MNDKVRWSLMLPKDLHAKLLKISREMNTPIHDVIIQMLEKMTEDVEV